MVGLVPEIRRAVVLIFIEKLFRELKELVFRQFDRILFVIHVEFLHNSAAAP